MANNILKGEIVITAPGVQQTMKSVNQSVVTLERSLTKSDAAITKSKTNFTGLNRILQDLPFGFVAISNNLEQLFPAAGAAGLAVSALTAAFTFAQIGLQNWSRLFPSANDKVKEHIKALHDAKEALNDYVESLDDVNRARIVGNQNAQEELIKLQTLRSAIENVNIPIAKRKQLVDQLQEQYPKYFKNISDETILTGGATNAYNSLASAILASARARAAQDVLVDISKQQLATEQEQLDNNQKLYDVSQKINALKATGAKLTITSATGEERLTSEGAKMNRLQEEYNDLISEGTKIQRSRIDLFDRSKKITSEITSITQANPDALLNPTGNLAKDKATKQAKDDLSNILDLINKIKLEAAEIKPIKITELPDTSLDPAVVQDFQSSVNDQLSRGGPDGIILTPEMNLEFENLKIKATAIKKLKDDFTKAVQSAFSSAALEGFEGIGESIGQAIAAGANPIAAAGQSILGAIGDLISQIGKALIEYGVVKEGLDKILVGGIAIPGVAAIAIGVSAVAIGALIKSSFKKIPGFAQGGEVPPGYPNDTFLARLSSGERIIPANQNPRLAPVMAGGGDDRTLVAEVHGDVLRLWKVRADATGRRYG